MESKENEESWFFMKKNYSEITKHIPSLEDHARLYMYYGRPYSEECYVYGENEDGKNLILSSECDDLCSTIAHEFENDYNWLDVLENSQVKLERIYDVDVETQDLDVIASLLLYLIESITFDDEFIDALNNGYVIRLLKRLEHWNCTYPENVLGSGEPE